MEFEVGLLTGRSCVDDPPMQYDSHSNVSVDEQDERQNELDENGQYSKHRLSDLAWPLCEDAATSAGQYCRRRCHIGDVVNRANDP